MMRIRRPPESPVARRAAEDLLIINPGGVAVQDHVGAVEGQALLPTRCNLIDIEVVVLRIGQAGRVRRPGQVDRPFRLVRKAFVLRRRLDAGQHPQGGQHHGEGRRIIETSVIAEHRLGIGDPLPAEGDALELLRGKDQARHAQRQEEEQFLHHSKKRSLKFTR